MDYCLKIWPNEELVSVIFWGDIIIKDLIELDREILRHPEYANHFNGVYDFRQASMRFSLKELTDMISSQQIRKGKGRWWSLNSSPLETGLAMIYGTIKISNNPFEVFSTVEAASDFLRTDLKKLGLR